MAKLHTALQQSTALWYDSDHQIMARTEMLPPVEQDEIRVIALHSAVSRGTERLVLQGSIPESEYLRMRCPHQKGAFPFPVQYGYGFVGRVETADHPLDGQTVFALHPHQSVINLPARDANLVPAAVPARRATLAANMETALNVIWDAALAPGDRVLVVGAGVVGLL
ncbi:MAG: dehydrogenase, partial [Pseudomonadota bacterium]